MKFGRGYTLRFPWNPSADFDQVILLLSHSMEYTIFMHDHEYIMVSENPLAFGLRAFGTLMLMLMLIL